MNNSTEMAGSRTQRRRMPSVEGYYDEIPAHGRGNSGRTKSNDKVSPVKSSKDSTLHPYNKVIHSLVQVTYKVQTCTCLSFSLRSVTSNHHTNPPITTLFIV
jgi:hypothetical protein